MIPPVSFTPLYHKIKFLSIENFFTNFYFSLDNRIFMCYNSISEKIKVQNKNYGGEYMKNDVMTKVRDTVRLAKENGDEAFLNRLCGMAQGYAAAIQRKKTEKK